MGTLWSLLKEMSGRKPLFSYSLKDPAGPGKSSGLDQDLIIFFLFP